MGFIGLKTIVGGRYMEHTVMVLPKVARIAMACRPV